jgi:hypothetical protein
MRPAIRRSWASTPTSRGSQDHGADHQPAWRYDGISPAPERDGRAKFFTASYERRVLPRIGHNVPQEAPVATVAAVRDLMKEPASEQHRLIGATGNIGEPRPQEALSHSTPSRPSHAIRARFPRARAWSSAPAARRMRRRW